MPRLSIGPKFFWASSKFALDQTFSDMGQRAKFCGQAKNILVLTKIYFGPVESQGIIGVVSYHMFIL